LPASSHTASRESAQGTSLSTTSLTASRYLAQGHSLPVSSQTAAMYPAQGPSLPGSSHQASMIQLRLGGLTGSLCVKVSSSAGPHWQPLESMYSAQGPHCQPLASRYPSQWLPTHTASRLCSPYWVLITSQRMHGCHPSLFVHR
jgi:hypothetical protein